MSDPGDFNDFLDEMGRVEVAPRSREADPDPAAPLEKYLAAIEYMFAGTKAVQDDVKVDAFVGNAFRLTLGDLRRAVAAIREAGAREGAS